MNALELHIPAFTSPAGDQLAELLGSWVAATPFVDRVWDVQVRDDGEAALATVSRGDERLQVRLHHAEPRSDRWTLDAASWLVPTEPSRPWSALAGFAVFAAGFAISLGYLAWSSLAFWIGVAASALLGVLLGRMTWRRALSLRSTPVAHERGAHELLDVLEPVVRADDRVQDVTPR